MRGTFGVMKATAPAVHLDGIHRDLPRLKRAARRRTFLSLLSRQWRLPLWTMSLLGLLLLPLDYRAGAEQAHGHSLFALGADAADGSIHHHGSRPLDWLDPAVEVNPADDAATAAKEQVDVGETQDSSPAPGGVHMLLAVVTLLHPTVSIRDPAVVHARRLLGRVPYSLSPPPRMAFAA